MPDKEIVVLKIVWRKSIASLQRLTQAVQPANLRRTAGDPTWVIAYFYFSWNMITKIWFRIFLCLFLKYVLAIR